MLRIGTYIRFPKLGFCLHKTHQLRFNSNDLNAKSVTKSKSLKITDVTKHVPFWIRQLRQGRKTFVLRTIFTCHYSTCWVKWFCVIPFLTETVDNIFFQLLITFFFITGCSSARCGGEFLTRKLLNTERLSANESKGNILVQEFIALYLDVEKIFRIRTSLCTRVL